MLGGAGGGDAEEDRDGAVEADHILGGKTAETRTNLGLGYGGDLIDHQSGEGAQAVGFAGFDRKAKKRCIGGIGGKRADGDGVGPVEAVVLKDDDRAGFPRVVFPTGNGPKLAALHALPHAEIASIKA